MERSGAVPRLTGESGGRTNFPLRSESTLRIEWVLEDGKTRKPHGLTTVQPACCFIAAGRIYPSTKLLQYKSKEYDAVCKDIYGREVYCYSERFPCFDSYDALYETRCYRWYFIKHGGKLTRVYCTDGIPTVSVTEDVRDIETGCAKRMLKHGFIENKEELL